MKKVSMKLKRFVCPALAFAMGAGILYGMPLNARAADHEARIGDTRYEELEEAFANAQAGDTITVLKDCSVSGTLRVTRDDITLKSENADAPVTVSRDEDFTGKTYGVNGGSVLLEVTGGSLTTRDIILDGGAVCSSAPLTVTDSLFEGNSSAYDGGGVCTATGHLAHITGCTFTGNVAARGSAIQTYKGEGTLPLVIRNCTFTGNRSEENIHAGGAICYGNETGIILSGKIIMEDNLSAGYEPCDIHYFYNTGASILLDEDFESDSTFVLGGYDTIKPGRVLIDGKLMYGKEASN